MGREQLGYFLLIMKLETFVRWQLRKTFDCYMSIIFIQKSGRGLWNRFLVNVSKMKDVSYQLKSGIGLLAGLSLKEEVKKLALNNKAFYLSYTYKLTTKIVLCT